MPDQSWLDSLASSITGIDAAIVFLVLSAIGVYWKMPEKRLDRFESSFLPTLKLFGLGLIALRATITFTDLWR